MNTSKIIAAAALTLLAAAGAQAETYDGVHAPVSAASRADVNAQAVAAARTANPYGDVSGAGVTEIASVANRSSVAAEAVATAHAPNQNLDRKSFVNSVIPAQYNIVRPATRQAGL